MLGLLALALPVDLAVTAWALLGRRPSRPVAPAGGRLTVLVSGAKMTKALHLARAFHSAGHRVVLAETATYRFTGHRFSRAVDRFRVLPDPRSPGYADGLLRVVTEEAVDVYVPVCSPAASLPDAIAATVLAGHCAVVHGDPESVATVDDKHAFARAAQSLGLPVPLTHLVTDAGEVAGLCAQHPGLRFVLKSIAYDPVNRLDLTLLPLPTSEETTAFAAGKPISAANPWILQEFVRGEEFCTHGTVRDGRLLVYCCCPSSAAQLNYAAVDEPAVERWVRDFVAGTRATGQLSFDMIKEADGTVRAIECNPRTHSAVTLFQDLPALAAAYLDADAAPIRPCAPGGAPALPTYWTYMEVWRLLRRPWTLAERVRVLRGGRDAVFDRDDPLPFLMLHHLHIPWLLLRNLLTGRSWVRVDLNIGKLVEPAGD